MIDGVRVTPLTTYADDRGYFREIARFDAKQCRQMSATMSYPGVIKAFHYHERQNDLWYCAKGMKLFLFLKEWYMGIRC
jgi:dTDP-4-dehydrorhamnose 3,5-epimerase